MSAIYTALCLGVIGVVIAFIGVVTISDARAGMQNAYNQRRRQSGATTTVIGGLLLCTSVILFIAA